MAETGRVAIVAALEREVWPLVKNWPRNRKTFDGSRTSSSLNRAEWFWFVAALELNAARRAAEAVIQLYDPAVVISAGFAGALNHEVQVGQVIVPRTVIDVNDGSRTDTGSGAGVLVTHSVVADAAQKAEIGTRPLVRKRWIWRRPRLQEQPRRTDCASWRTRRFPMPAIFHAGYDELLSERTENLKPPTSRSMLSRGRGYGAALSSWRGIVPKRPKHCAKSWQPWQK